MQGWIKLHRTILDWEWHDDPKVFATFIHCLFEANYETKKWHGIVIERGSFISGQKELAKRIGVSHQQLRTCLEKLKSTNELTIETTNNYTHISINNYNKYQLSTSELTNDQQTDNKRITTTKEYKEIKNKEINKEKAPAEKRIPFSDGTLLDLDAEIELFLREYNQSRHTKFKTIGNTANYQHWRSIYSFAEIVEALNKIGTDPFWRDKMTPTIFFRQKNPNGDSIDYIGMFLSRKEV